MDILDNYLDIREEIYDYFDYEEEYFDTLNIDDSRDYYWSLHQENDKNIISFARTKENLYNGIEGYYEGEIYTIYKGKDYTMMYIGTRVNNESLQIFDNKKEVI